MQHKNKIMIGLLSLLVILAIVLIVKFKIAVKGNNIVEGTVSSTEDKLSKAEYSKNESDVSEDTTSSSSKKEKEGSDLSNNTSYNKNSQGENGEGATGSASIKENFSSRSNMNLKNTRRYTSSKRDYSINIKDDAVRVFSKEDKKNKSMTTNKNQENKEERKNNIGNLNKEKNVKGDAVSSASKKEDKNTNSSSTDTSSQMKSGDFIDTAINKDATKLVDLGWVKYIVVTFSEGTIEDYNLYVLDGKNYKRISSSKVDDNGKIVKWEIDKLGYNKIKVISKNSGKEGLYKFARGKINE